MCRFTFVVALASCAVAASLQAAFARDDLDIPSALHAMNDIQWSQMTVRIIDPEGNPLPGATVEPWALRTGSTHGAWNEAELGSPRQTTTDRDGRTEVVYPRSINWGLKEFHAVLAVSLYVRHPEFCSKNVHVTVPDDAGSVSDISLERGFKLRFAGVEPGDDRPLSHCHLLLEKSLDSTGPDFIREPDDWLQSVPIKENRRWFRIVRAVPGEPPQFSKPQSWSPDDPASCEAMVVVPYGVRVTGKISDNVPRPIVRGYVCVHCGSPAPRDDGGNPIRVNRPIFWWDTAPIAEDGSFEFPSLPAGFLGQFYAFANDSISAQPTDEAYETCCNWFGVEKRQRRNSFRYGQMLRLAGAESKLAIQMEPAGQARLKCTTPEGVPLAGITVTTWPNQLMIGAGSRLLCSRLSSLDILRGDQRSVWKHESPYSATTDQNGEAVIRNLPTGTQSFYADNEFWVLDAEQQAVIQLDSVAELTIKLERRR